MNRQIISNGKTERKKQMATKEQATFYDNFLSHFEAQVNNGRNMSWRNWIRKWVKEKSSVLDVGCAYGYNSEFLFREATICKVTGIDISPKCIEVAKQKYPHGTWHCGDITEGYDIGEKDFKYILMSDVIEHVPSNRRLMMLTKLAEWTKTGGALIASIPNAELHEQITKDTFQPVEEQVWMHQLLEELYSVGFKRIITLFLEAGIYYRLIVQKV
jgi:2-polyprenyl-3-methyl-5-hydroxy-6-metoxy-1,4-benzoquinol methylase